MTSKELHHRRGELSASLSELTRTRDHAYRLKSDAEALDRYGVTRHTAAEMARLEQDRIAADAAIRAVQLEIREVDEQLTSPSRGRLTASIGRVVHRG
jgi:hypothetical protein